VDQKTEGHRLPTRAILVICCIAQFMVVLDVAIVNVALPQMRDSLGLSVAGQQWVVNAYTLTFAGFLMLGGRAADLFGRRRIFMAGLGVFTICSLLGGMAQSGSWLIAARTAQGIGAAILAPATLSILVTTFTDPSERRRALGAWSATAASGAAVGVLAGGVLTSLLNWRWVLFVNVPIGIVLMVAAWMTLPRTEEARPKRTLDIMGAVTVTAGLAIVVYGIVSTNVHPWGSAQTIITLAIGFGFLAVFFLNEARFARDPLVPLGIFRRRSLSVANGIAVTIGAGLFGTYFFLSLYLQDVDGYSALRTGLAFLPAGLCTLAGALIGTRLVQVMGARRQLVLGPAMAAGGLFWLSSIGVGDSYFAHVLGPLVLIGLGLGMSFVPMTLSATTGVPQHEAGLASGLINTTRQVGGALGLAIMATIATSIATNQLAAHHDPLGAVTAGYRAAFIIGGAGLLLGAMLALVLPKLPAAAASAPVATLEEALEEAGEPQVAFEG
jgi:EmrB/QacA subfamily drug resistance transporter